MQGGNPADKAQEAKTKTIQDFKHDILVHVKRRYLAIIKAIVFPPIRVRMCMLAELFRSSLFLFRNRYCLLVAHWWSHSTAWFPSHWRISLLVLILEYYFDGSVGAVHLNTDMVFKQWFFAGSWGDHLHHYWACHWWSHSNCYCSCHLTGGLLNFLPGL